MQDMSAWAQAFGGVVIGLIAGFAVRHARLCSFGAIEDAMMGGDTRRLRVFALALGIAILGTQALIVAGLFDPTMSTYTPTSLPIVSILIGSIAFGIGMALVGTCGFGSLVRLGTGDLRSLIVVLILGIVAFATLRGIFASFRIVVLERFAVAMPESATSDLASLTSRLGAIDTRAMIAAGFGIALCWLALGDKRLRRAPRLLSSGIALGLLVIAGWLVTLYAHDDFGGPPHPQSLTFVSTIGKSVFAGLGKVTNFADFGVGSVFGVIAGSWLAAWRLAELKWEAFDDDHEMRRHLTGAVLMGFGGILAGGCTIGQGLTAGSMLALSWPLAVGGMMLGARIGIAILIEGSPRDAVRQGWTRLIQGRR